MAGGRWLLRNPFVISEPGPEEIAETRDLHERVLRAVQALSPANRDAVLLFYYEQLSLREIAALLGISETALKGRLHRARRQLRTDLLPVHDSLQGGKIMIDVKFANLLRVEQNMIIDEKPGIEHVMLLLDEAGRRVLPLWIGEHESQMLNYSLQYTHQKAAGNLPGNWRPVTFVLMARILETLNAEIESVQVSALISETFYATLRLRSGGTVHELDARPSDVVPLALMHDKPLRVSADIQTWWSIPADFEITDSLLSAGPPADIKAGLVTAHLDYEQQFTKAEWDEFMARWPMIDDAEKDEYREKRRARLYDFVFDQ